VETYPTGFRVVQESKPTAVDYQTLPFPGFPTDLQPMAIALCVASEGMCVITENIFESRFRFVDELVRLGADASVDGHHVVIRGGGQLSSAPLWSSGIRAGVRLVLVWLIADGAAEGDAIYHLDRGYEYFVGTLRDLGADIRRVER